MQCLALYRGAVAERGLNGGLTGENKGEQGTDK